MKGSRRATLYLLLVFLLGGVLGSLATYWAHEAGWPGHLWDRGRGSRSGMVDRLTRELDLSTEQQRQLHAILEDTAAGYRAIRERVRPDYEQVRQAGRDKIRAMLNDQQRVKFEELVRQIDEQRRERREKQSQKSN